MQVRKRIPNTILFSFYNFFSASSVCESCCAVIFSPGIQMCVRNRFRAPSYPLPAHLKGPTATRKKVFWVFTKFYCCVQPTLDVIRAKYMYTRITFVQKQHKFCPKFRLLHLRQRKVTDLFGANSVVNLTLLYWPTIR